MELFDIQSNIPFPEVSSAREDGLLCYGGEVSVERLLQAYPLGIFPWYNAGQPPLWWSPHERCVLFPEFMHCSKNLRRIIRQERFELRVDSAFDQVVQACGHVGANRNTGTWLNQELRAAFSELHKMGLAHSFESWKNDRLVGGLYGLSLGNMFFGESMFAAESDASKVALYHLCEFMMTEEMDLIDCQIPNEHLFSLGAEMMDGEEFYPLLRESVKKKTRKGPWSVQA